MSFDTYWHVSAGRLEEFQPRDAAIDHAGKTRLTRQDAKVFHVLVQPGSSCNYEDC
jgi:hypothetical protein